MDHDVVDDQEIEVYRFELILYLFFRVASLRVEKMFPVFCDVARDAISESFCADAMVRLAELNE